MLISVTGMLAWDNSLYGPIDSGRKPLRFNLDDGSKLVLTRVVYGRPIDRRPDLYVVSGWGYTVGKKSDGTSFYLGNFSRATRRAELWLGSENDAQLIYSMHNRSAADQRAYRAALREERRHRRIAKLWVSEQQAESLAREMGTSPHYAGQVVRRLKAFTDVLEERPFAVKVHYLYGFQVDFRSLRNHIHREGRNSIHTFSQKADDTVEAVVDFADSSPSAFRALTK